jgi:hypothetical protein
MSVPLVTGRDYALGTFWSSTAVVKYAWPGPDALQELSFATLLGDAYVYSYKTPPATFEIEKLEQVPGWMSNEALGLRVHTAAP